VLAQRAAAKRCLVIGAEEKQQELIDRLCDRNVIVAKQRSLSGKLETILGDLRRRSVEAGGVMAPLRRRPFWWRWDVELSTHVERRMSRRDFNELDLRMMTEHAERKAGKTRELAPRLVGDFDKGGALLGLEILAFDKNTVARINAVLVSRGRPALPAKELAPPDSSVPPGS